MLDIYRVGLIQKDAPGSDSVTVRESSFLDSPLTPERVRRGEARVVLVRSAREGASSVASAHAEASIVEGASEVQIRQALAAQDSAPVLSISSTDGLFGGWVSRDAHRRFETMLLRSSVLSGTWCCSSWYKPSGSVAFARPAPTRVLPAGCGRSADPSTEAKHCLDEQLRRRAEQAPVALVYDPAPGPDGYWELRGQPMHS